MHSTDWSSATSVRMGGRSPHSTCNLVRRMHVRLETGFSTSVFWQLAFETTVFGIVDLENLRFLMTLSKHNCRCGVHHFGTFWPCLSTKSLSEVHDILGETKEHARFGEACALSDQCSFFSCCSLISFVFLIQPFSCGVFLRGKRIA